MPDTRESKKELVLDAAFETFLKKGYMNTKMSEVAARSGLAKTTIYGYFSSKESLFVELLQSRVAVPYMSIGERLDRTLPYSGQLRQFIEMEMEMLFGLIQEKKIVPSLLLYTEFFTDTNVTETAQKILSYKFRTFIDIIGKGMESGEFRPGDPATAAACVIGAFNLYTAIACKASMEEMPDSFSGFSQDNKDFYEIIFSGLLQRTAMGNDE
ncbi:MAG: TetR/AcrR family transcriptional regulator [Clostridiales Family XIII bacterium]|jgi:AcrR family transcriptional regulator|nr:TetR/AcrR family transcriptional regulator [Clostridiales Family XIII bacterium]